MENLNEQDQVNYDLDMYEVEKEWKRTLPNLTPVGWLNIFPEAKKHWGRGIKLSLIVNKISILNEIDILKWYIPHKVNLAYSGSEGKDKDWLADLIIENGRKQIKELEKKLRATEERIKFYHRIGRKENPNAKKKRVEITEDMVRKAKEFPIEKLLEINKAGFTRCFAHRDSKPSAYCKKNFLYCFVCSKSWDTIAILMERDGYKYPEAVITLQ